ncbi:MAG: hypothetical protein Q9211_003696 [Gyalolechia sp. 1 TL-2023]
MTPATTSARQTHSAGQRVQALAYLQAGWQQKDVANAVGLSQSAISKLAAKAKERGWNPKDKPIIELEWVVDKPRTGRPHALTPEKEAQVIKKVENGNRNERELSAAAIAQPLGVSDSTIRRILRKLSVHQGISRKSSVEVAEMNTVKAVKEKKTLTTGHIIRQVENDVMHS